MTWTGGWFGPSSGGGAAKYDPTGHSLLSPAALGLSSIELDAQAVAAEALLTVGGTSLGDTAFEAGTPEYDRARLAVVYQVNYQLAQGVDAEVYESLSRGERSMKYREILISPRAEALIRSLIVGAWRSAGSIR